MLNYKAKKQSAVNSILHLRAVKPPKMAPVAMPTEKPITKPNLTLSQQLGP